jgi:hypothetical protein
MFNFLKVLGRMLVLRRVATSHMPTCQAKAQMNPRISHLHALFTDMLIGVLQFDLIEMRALAFHRFSCDFSFWVK